jgi:hypothetical protein
MPRFEYDPKISLGNILTAGTLLVAVVISWADLDKKNATQDAAIALLEKQGGDRETRLRATELSLNSLGRDFGNIRESLGEIKADLRRLVEGAKP